MKLIFAVLDVSRCYKTEDCFNTCTIIRPWVMWKEQPSCQCVQWISRYPFPGFYTSQNHDSDNSSNQKSKATLYTNRSRWQLQCITTWGRPTPRQSFFHFNYDATKSLKLSVAVLLRFYCWYLMLRCALDLWPWTYVVYCLCRGQTLYQIWAQSSNPRRRYCDLNISPNDLEHVSSVMLGSGIIFTEFELDQPNCSWFTAFFADDTLCHIMTLIGLWPFYLETLWYIVFIICSKFEWNRTIPAELLKIRPPDRYRWRP